MPTADDRLIIVAYDWDQGQPWLRVRPVGGNSKLVPAIGYSLSYRVDDPPRWHCPGRVPFRPGEGDYHDCFNRPQPTSRLCVDCAVAEATLAGSLHHAHLRDPAELDSDVESRLHQPNVLYLAAFADGSTKVGTSTAGRADRRLVEQGAWRARRVAEAVDGIAVRVAEDLVTDRLGLTQAVTAGRKVAGLVNPMEEDALDERLDALVAEVHRLIEEVAPSGITPTDEAWANPAADTLDPSRLFAYPADPRRDSHRFTIVTMVGRVAIVERDETGGPGADRFALDLGPLFGLELELGRFEPVELLVQDSLF